MLRLPLPLAALEESGTSVPKPWWLSTGVVAVIASIGLALVIGTAKVQSPALLPVEDGSFARSPVEVDRSAGIAGGRVDSGSAGTTASGSLDRDVAQRDGDADAMRMDTMAEELQQAWDAALEDGLVPWDSAAEAAAFLSKYTVADCIAVLYSDCLWDTKRALLRCIAVSGGVAGRELLAKVVQDTARSLQLRVTAAESLMQQPWGGGYVSRADITEQDLGALVWAARGDANSDLCTALIPQIARALYSNDVAKSLATREIERFASSDHRPEVRRAAVRALVDSAAPCGDFLVGVLGTEGNAEVTLELARGLLVVVKQSRLGGASITQVLHRTQEALARTTDASVREALAEVLAALEGTVAARAVPK